VTETHEGEADKQAEGANLPRALLT